MLRDVFIGRNHVDISGLAASLFFKTIATSWLSSLVSHFFFFLFENFLIYLWHSLSSLSSHQIIACALAVHALRRVGREGSE